MSVRAPALAAPVVAAPRATRSLEEVLAVGVALGPEGAATGIKKWFARGKSNPLERLKAVENGTTPADPEKDAEAAEIFVLKQLQRINSKTNAAQSGKVPYSFFIEMDKHKKMLEKVGEIVKRKNQDSGTRIERVKNIFNTTFLALMDLNNKAMQKEAAAFLGKLNGGR